MATKQSKVSGNSAATIVNTPLITIDALQTIHTPQSVKDAAYQFARSNETSATMAQYIVDQDSDFPEKISPELRGQLYAGFMLRSNELRGSEVYTYGEGDTLIRRGNTVRTPDFKMPEKAIEFSVYYCASMGAQDFGQLKSKHPQQHGIIKAIREDFQKYASNTLGDIVRAAKRLLNDGDTQKRAVASHGFIEALEKAFDVFDKRVKTASNRGDATANETKYLAAKNAFWNIYKV